MRLHKGIMKKRSSISRKEKDKEESHFFAPYLFSLRLCVNIFSALLLARSALPMLVA